MGRHSVLKLEHITCRFPDGQPALEMLRNIAHVAEINAQEMYLKKSRSLQHIHAVAERTHAHLLQFAQATGIGSSSSLSTTPRLSHNEVFSFILHGCKLILTPISE